jgi:hypothetical protein
MGAVTLTTVFGACRVGIFEHFAVAPGLAGAAATTSLHAVLPGNGTRTTAVVRPRLGFGLGTFVGGEGAGVGHTDTRYFFH